MTTTPAPAASLVARRAAVDLAAVREQWGDLLAAIGRRPAAEWPPRECAGFLDQLAADDRAEDDEQPTEAVVGRLPLLLREHPAPLNLDALDAAIEVERELFDLADAVAGHVQRPIRPARDSRGRSIPDQADAADPARWHTATHRDAGAASAASAGSRAFGLHWAAMWLEGRALDETYGDLFTPIPALVLDQVAAVARRARRTVERALGRDGRTTALAEACPWCGGSLTGRTRPGGEPVVVCSAGEACSAPADGRRRGEWRGAELVALWGGLAEVRGRPAA
ncbi:zinc ribbon domain-containing protein [Streptomyces sp. CC224B]|uniref:zinc ribbon domain-containing protein n=1 Tax=Streptomyces sp. CC224B TaxID=3044571 RepID=UPI0024A9D866|nr:zinc ribbon domain-containing protein [Streptomyces sp. CC224B]